MLIHELARVSGVSAKTIRYYESIGLMPPARRAPNNYRLYAPDAAERLRFIASARSLGFALADIADMLGARDAGIAPCSRVLAALDQRLSEIDRRVADMLLLRETLLELRREGASLPQDDVQGERCICALLKTLGAADRVPAERCEVHHAGIT